MKTSNKILFITAIVIIIMLFASILGSRLFLIEHTNSSAKIQPSRNAMCHMIRCVSSVII